MYQLYFIKKKQFNLNKSRSTLRYNASCRNTTQMLKRKKKGEKGAKYTDNEAENKREKVGVSGNGRLATASSMSETCLTLTIAAGLPADKACPRLCGK